MASIRERISSKATYPVALSKRIEAGEFNSKVEYPSRVKAPSGYKDNVENIIKQAPKGSELEVLTKVGKRIS